MPFHCRAHPHTPPHTHSLTLTTHLMFTSLGCRKKPSTRRKPMPTHADMGRLCKLHRDSGPGRDWIFFPIVIMKQRYLRICCTQINRIIWAEACRWVITGWKVQGAKSLWCKRQGNSRGSCLPALVPIFRHWGNSLSLTPDHIKLPTAGSRLWSEEQHTYLRSLPHPSPAILPLIRFKSTCSTLAGPHQ